MRRSLHKFAIAITCLVSLLATAEASAIYDPGTGRFLQRDPSGTPGFNTAPRMGGAGMVGSTPGSFLERDTDQMYPDGMNLYAAYHVMHGGVDPSGLQQAVPTPTGSPAPYTGPNPIGRIGPTTATGVAATGTAAVAAPGVVATGTAVVGAAAVGGAVGYGIYYVGDTIYQETGLENAVVNINSGQKPPNKKLRESFIEAAEAQQQNEGIASDTNQKKGFWMCRANCGTQVMNAAPPPGKNPGCPEGYSPWVLGIGRTKADAERRSRILAKDAAYIWIEANNHDSCTCRPKHCGAKWCWKM